MQKAPASGGVRSRWGSGCARRLPRGTSGSCPLHPGDSGSGPGAGRGCRGTGAGPEWRHSPGSSRAGGAEPLPGSAGAVSAPRAALYLRGNPRWPGWGGRSCSGCGGWSPPRRPAWPARCPPRWRRWAEPWALPALPCPRPPSARRRPSRSEPSRSPWPVPLPQRHRPGDAAPPRPASSRLPLRPPEPSCTHPEQPPNPPSIPEPAQASLHPAGASLSICTFPRTLWAREHDCITPERPFVPPERPWESTRSPLSRGTLALPQSIPGFPQSVLSRSPSLLNPGAALHYLAGSLPAPRIYLHSSFPSQLRGILVFSQSIPACCTATSLHLCKAWVYFPYPPWVHCSCRGVCAIMNRSELRTSFAF